MTIILVTEEESTRSENDSQTASRARTCDAPARDLGAPRYLIAAIADQLRRARAASSAGGGAGRDAGGDADLDAELILAAAAGLTQTLLVDASAAERADALLDRLLDRLVTT